MVLSRNLGKAVVALVAVLGSKTAGVLTTPSLITRGIRVSGSAKHGHSLRELTADSLTQLND